MSDIGRTAYQATYRRTELALPALLGVLVLGAAGAIVGLALVDAQEGLTIIVILFAIMMTAMLVILVATFRVHRWTIAADGVHIHERPKLPLTGLVHAAVVAYPDIAALRRVESALDPMLEIVTRAGRRYRMMRAMTGPWGRRVPNPDAGLDAFADAIRAGARRAGHLVPALSEGLSFWNRPAGLACLSAMLLVALAITGGAAWVMVDSWLRGLPVNARMISIVFLPPAAGYVLLRAIQRRRAVLAALDGGRRRQ